MPYSKDKPTLLCNKLLNNKLTVCVLNEFEERKSSLNSCISISINKGHYDACAFPEGLAHLFEHMLFTGSKHFPEAKKLNNHLFKHHGQFNAWTQDESINIQMSCNHDGFFTAIDILIDRLCFPLFQIEDIKKEVSVIDAEFSSQKSDPLRRLISVQKATCNPKHPFSRFSSGNANSLNVKNADQLRGDLIQFHKSSIQGQNMSVCIGLSHPEADLIYCQKVSEKFRQIPCDQTNISDLKLMHPCIYKKEQLKKLILINQDIVGSQLIMSYIVKPKCDKNFNYRNSAYLMLSHMIESKHKNGLFYRLNKQGLAEDLSCDFRHLDSENDEFFISISFKESSVKATFETYEIVNQYIEFIQNKGIEEWRLREKSNQYELAKKLERQPGLQEKCIDLSLLLLHNKTAADHDSYSFANNRLEFSTKVVNDILHQIKPDNLRVFFVSKKAISKNDDMNTTPHFEVKYAVRNLLNDKKRFKNLVFEKPRQNPYMSNALVENKPSLKQSSPLLVKNERLNFKFYPNTQFNSATGESYISLSDPEMGSTAEQVNIKRIWVECLKKACSTLFFDAHLASLHHRIYAHKTGVTIHIQGVSEKQILFAIELLNLVLNFKATGDELKSALASAKKRSLQSTHIRPLNQMFNKLIELYQQEQLNNVTTQNALTQLTETDLLNQQEKFFERCYAECLMIGNWQVEEAQKFCDILNKRLKSRKPFKRKIVHSKPFANGIHSHTQIESSSSVLVWHYTPLYKHETSKLENNYNHVLLNKIGARSIILERLLSFTVFDVLRQKHKMGYSLGVGYKPIGKLPGIAIYVESPSHSEQEIFNGIEEVLLESIELLSGKQFNFDKLKQDLIRQVTPEDKNLRQMANRAWLHFDEENPLNGYLELIESIQETTVTEIKQFIEQIKNSDNHQVIATLSSKESVYLSRVGII